MKVKRILSVILCIAMVLSTMSFTVFATEGGAEDTTSGEATVTEIGSVAELNAFAEAVNNGDSFSGKTVKLTADIDLSGTPWQGIGVYKDDQKAFSGTFDGQMHTISNVTFADCSEGVSGSEANNYRGFFNHIYKATVKNLTVSGNGFDTATIGSTEYGGALIVGHANQSTIKNCVAMGNISGTHNVAGIVVRLQDAVINRCTNEANITGSYSKIGGIATLIQNSETGSVIEGCVNKGTITSTARGEDGVGGIVGWVGYPNVDNIKVIDNENKGTITATDTATVGQIAAESWNGRHVFNGNKGLATMPATGHAAMNGLNYALVQDGIAVYVNDSDLTPGNTYLVTASGAKPVITLEEGETMFLQLLLQTLLML